MTSRRFEYLRRRRGQSIERPRHDRGQSLVEFALVLPILLILMATAIDLGRLFYAYVAVENAAKEGAFFGARSPLCPDTGNPDCPDPLNVKWRVENEAANLRNALDSTSLLSTQSTCRDSTGKVVEPITNCVDGNIYVVEVSYDFRLLTPILSEIVGSGLTLASEARAVVLNDAYDPTGLEALIWVNSAGADNTSAISSICTQADSGSAPGYYYGPCQDATNGDNYLRYPKDGVVTYRVRIRNTGGINIAAITYQFATNGSAIAKPGDCTGLPASLVAGAAPSYCTFTQTATAPSASVSDEDFVVSLAAQGTAQGLTTGMTTGVATVRVVP